MYGGEGSQSIAMPLRFTHTPYPYVDSDPYPEAEAETDTSFRQESPRCRSEAYNKLLRIEYRMIRSVLSSPLLSATARKGSSPSLQSSSPSETA
jgi:hypothetical protein